MFHDPLGSTKSVNRLDGVLTDDVWNPNRSRPVLLICVILTDDVRFTQDTTTYWIRWKWHQCHNWSLNGRRLLHPICIVLTDVDWFAQDVFRDSLGMTERPVVLVGVLTDEVWFTQVVSDDSLETTERLNLLVGALTVDVWCTQVVSDYSLGRTNRVSISSMEL